MAKDHWMQGVAEHMHKGALHRALGVPAGDKIPQSKLAEGARSRSPKIRKEVGLAKAFASGRHAHHPPAR